MKILLFYKNIIIDGGAERLLIEEYLAFKRLGYDVFLVTFEFNSNLAIGGEIKEEDVIVLRRWRCRGGWDGHEATPAKACSVPNRRRYVEIDRGRFSRFVEEALCNER